MTSKLKLGTFKAVLRGTGRSRTVALFDYAKVAAGHLMGRLTSGEINNGFIFKELDDRQNRLIRKWMNAPTGYKPSKCLSSHPASTDREFPAESQVLHQFLIQTQGPASDVTTNEDGEISSKTVTGWYVTKYCELNHLTR